MQSSRSQETKKRALALCSMRDEPVCTVNDGRLIDREPLFWPIGLAIGHHIQSPRVPVIRRSMTGCVAKVDIDVPFMQYSYVHWFVLPC